MNKEATYYLIDFCPMCSEYRWEVTILSKEEFIESLTYNHDVAEEYGDDVPELDKVLKELEEKEDYEADTMNGFGFLKLTNMTPQEWGYPNE